MISKTRHSLAFTAFTAPFHVIVSFWSLSMILKYADWMHWGWTCLNRSIWSSSSIGTFEARLRTLETFEFHEKYENRSSQIIIQFSVSWARKKPLFCRTKMHCEKTSDGRLAVAVLSSLRSQLTASRAVQQAVHKQPKFFSFFPRKNAFTSHEGQSFGEVALPALHDFGAISFWKCKCCYIWIHLMFDFMCLYHPILLQIDP